MNKIAIHSNIPMLFSDLVRELVITYPVQNVPNQNVPNQNVPIFGQNIPTKTYPIYIC